MALAASAGIAPRGIRTESTRSCISWLGALVIRLTTMVTTKATGRPNSAEEMLRTPNHSSMPANWVPTR